MNMSGIILPQLRVSSHLSCYSFLPRSFHMSATRYKRMSRRVTNVPEWKRQKLAQGPWWQEEKHKVKAPLSKTLHPDYKFAQIEGELQKTVAEASADDAPIEDMEDPYKKESSMCILCPRKYEEDVTPNYKNPKLLSQFVSPHTGRLYDSHITGLCTYMQGLVEKEIKRSISAGFMSTKVKSPHYYQDPALFNPSKPVMKNPY